MSLLSDSLPLFAQTTSAAPSPGMGLGQLAFPLLLMGGLYFILIAPQRKKQKELEKQIGALQTGDDVITTGGIYGTITNVKDDRFVVRISDNTKIELGKGFVASVVKKTEAK
jgi:preprotein translocase subunit YajC